MRFGTNAPRIWDDAPQIQESRNFGERSRAAGRVIRGCLPALLAVASCGRGEDTPRPLVTPSSRPASAIAPSSASAGAVAPVRSGPRPPPPVVKQFQDDAGERCPDVDNDGTTLGMTQASLERTECVAELVVEDLRELDEKSVGVLLDADPTSPRGHSQQLAGSVWLDTAGQVCRYKEFQRIVHGGTMFWGTMRSIIAAEHLQARHYERGYLARALGKDAPPQVVAMLRLVVWSSTQIDNFGRREAA